MTRKTNEPIVALYYRLVRELGSHAKAVIVLMLIFGIIIDLEEEDE